MSRSTTKDFHLKAIFSLLTRWRVRPDGRRAAGRRQRFLPGRCAGIRRGALAGG